MFPGCQVWREKRAREVRDYRAGREAGNSIIFAAGGGWCEHLAKRLQSCYQCRAIVESDVGILLVRWDLFVTKADRQTDAAANSFL